MLLHVAVDDDVDDDVAVSDDVASFILGVACRLVAGE